MLSAEPACSQGPLVPTRPRRTRARDILRKERFGALYYHRDTCRFSAVPPNLARLLCDAAERPIVDAYAAEPTGFGITDQAFAEQVVRWRHAGVLDADLRLDARVVDHDRSHDALIGPLVSHIQLTRQCNLRCKHCYVDIMAKPAPDELTTSEVFDLFAELEDCGSPVVVLAGGEPMLRHDFAEILGAVERYGLDAWLCTNGTLIDERAADQLAQSSLRGISVSLDGPNDEIHGILRGPHQFDRTTRGIERLIAAGADDVQIRVTVTPRNVDHLVEFAEVARRLGVHKVVFKPFRQSGMADGAAALTIARVAYAQAMVDLAEAWPDDVCPAELGDGMPTRPPDWTNIIPSFGCVGGTTSVTVTYDAKVVGCGSVLTPADWTLRNATFTECWRGSPAVTSWRKLAGNDECGRCSNFERCGGGCRARAVGVGRTINDSDPWAYCSDEGARRLVVI